MTELPLVTLKIFNPEIEPEEIIGFNAYDEETQNEIVRMKRNAEDQTHFYEAVKFGEPLLFKVSEYAVDIFNDVIRLKTPCGQFITIENPDDEVLEYLKMSREETVYIKCTVRPEKIDRKKVLIAENIEFNLASVDTDTAKELLNEYPAYELLTLGFGFKNVPDGFALITPRLLALFRPQNTPLHVICFEPPNTGKSTFASLCERLTTAYFYTETPTPANLVGDARYNTYGVAYHYKTIIFDEFDKIASLERQKLEELWKILQTGMANGVWKRGVSSKVELSFRNVVSCLFFGNVSDEDLSSYDFSRLTDNHKEKLAEVIREKYHLSVKQFISRIAYAHYIHKSPTTDEVLNVKDYEVVYLDPKVTRGIIKLIDIKMYKEFTPLIREKKGRTTRIINALNTALIALGLDVSDKVVMGLFDGQITFFDYFRNKPSDVEDKVNVKEVEKKIEEEESTETEKPEETDEEIEDIEFNLESALS